jgi:hypothetical protein
MAAVGIRTVTVQVGDNMNNSAAAAAAFPT